jgi:dihydroxyacetone kinase-like predicted kinase
MPRAWRQGADRLGRLAFSNGLPGLGRASFAAEAIDAGEVTQAVRASTTPAGPVAEGDWLGIVRGDGIVAVAPDVVTATTALLDRLLGDDRELVTLIRGADAGEAETTAIEAWLEANRPSVEVETHEGGQPLYPFLVGVE